MLATLLLYTSSVPLDIRFGGDKSVLKKLSLKERFFGFHFAAAADDISTTLYYASKLKLGAQHMIL